MSRKLRTLTTFLERWCEDAHGVGNVGLACNGVRRAWDLVHLEPPLELASSVDSESKAVVPLKKDARCLLDR